MIPQNPFFIFSSYDHANNINNIKFDSPLTDIVGSGSCGKSSCKFDLDTSSIKVSMNVAKSLHRFDTSCFTASIGLANS